MHPARGDLHSNEPDQAKVRICEGVGVSMLQSLLSVPHTDNFAGSLVTTDICPGTMSSPPAH